MQACVIEDLGLTKYQWCWDYQKSIFQKMLEKKESGILHHLLFTEHHPVYTLGKSADKANMLVTPQWLASKGADVFEIERGGDITYHGPGQLVVYPIFDIAAMGLGIRRYIESLEEAIIQTLQHFQIESRVVQGRVGVWLDVGLTAERKIAAIGVKATRFVTMHGLALNVNTDLNMFNHIVPCGIPDKGVTSMQKELNDSLDMQVVKDILLNKFLSIFDLQIQEKK